MRKVFLQLALLASFSQAQAQLNITPNATAQQLVNKLVSTSGTAGVVTSNATMLCDTIANATLTGNSLLGISDGIVLCTGKALSDSSTIYPGLNGPFNWTASNVNATNYTDPDLVSLIASGNPVINDACVLEFDLQPVGNFI